MRRDEVWHSRISTYIETNNPSGYDVLINGSNKYLNFNLISGITGYGFRDNEGVIEVKDSSGAWTPIASGLGTTLWGTITGTLADQTDLQNALNAKVPTTRTVAGKALSSNITIATPDLSDISDSDTPARNDVLKYNGSEYTPAPYNYDFSMTISTFSSSEVTNPQLIGTGTWRASGGALTFSASYLNPPPNSASINVSGTGVSWTGALVLLTPFTSGTSAENTSYPSAADTTITFTLTAYDGATPRTATSTTTFNNYLFYGASTTGSGFTESQVEALSNAISSSYTTSRSINAGASNYVVWAYPSRYTSIHTTGAIFNSVTMPFTAPETVSITNSAGFTENYKVFASTLTNLGNSTLQLSTSSTTINKIYYGISTESGTITEAQVEALATSVVSNTKGRTITPTAGASDYIWYCYPSRLGTVTFTVDGFSGGFQSPQTLSITNVNGFAEDYYCYRSTNLNLGTVSIVIT